MERIIGFLHRRREKPEYPGTLDVVEWHGSQYQLVGSVQTGNTKKDIYFLKNTETEEVFRVHGARFQPAKVTSEPTIKGVYRIDEGVRVTGILSGGKKEK